MTLSLTIHNPIFYVLKGQRELPETKQIRFKIRPLSQREFIVLCDDEKYKEMRAHKFFLLGIGLLGWDNFNDENGNAILFTKENWDAHVTTAVANELKDEIFRLSTVSEEEKKSSELQPAS